MKSRYFTLLLLLIVAAPLFSQDVLDAYVRESFSRSPRVQEKESLERKQDAALRHAGKLFGPEVHFNTTYTVATGGRTVDLPLGTLLNEAYSTLNDLTDTERFPQIEDQSFTFLPHNFYDARLRFTQPILRPELKLNKLIKEEELKLTGLQTDQTKRDLARDVKTAYFQWLQAQEGIRIIDQGLQLLAENKRITESLIRNGQAIPSALLRINAQINRLEAQKQKAEADRENAAYYFNFLLNREPDAAILEDVFDDVPDPPATSSIEHKEELKQIESGRRITELARTIEKKYYAPKLGLQVDVGSQAHVPDWGGYVLGGISLDIPIWDNQKSKIKQQEWSAQLEATSHQYNYARDAFMVQVETTRRTLASASAIYHSYTSLVNSNQRLYDETLRRYKEGLANYIELLDAQTQVTETQLEQNLSKYEAWIYHAELERLHASLSIN